MLERVAPLRAALASPIGRRGRASCWPRPSPRRRTCRRFANTAMDGYAVQAADTAGAVRAAPGAPARWWPRWPPATPPTVRSRPGEAMRIFTGAPMPDGADAIVMVERTERLDDGAAVAIQRRGRRRASTCGPRATTCAPATRCSPPASVLTPGHLGVLAGIGAAEVLAHPRPRVGVLSTGDELVPAGRAARPGPDPRLEPPHAARARGARPAATRSTSGSSRDDEAAITAAHRGRRGDVRRSCSRAAACRWATSTS